VAVKNIQHMEKNTAAGGYGGVALFERGSMFQVGTDNIHHNFKS
jgi:hypothetical protein